MGVNLVYVIKLGGEVMLRVVPPPIRKLAETRVNIFELNFRLIFCKMSDPKVVFAPHMERCRHVVSAAPTKEDLQYAEKLRRFEHLKWWYSKIKYLIALGVLSIFLPPPDIIGARLWNVIFWGLVSILLFFPLHLQYYITPKCGASIVVTIRRERLSLYKCLNCAGVYPSPNFYLDSWEGLIWLTSQGDKRAAKWLEKLRAECREEYEGWIESRDYYWENYYSRFWEPFYYPPVTT